jgi:hypothetical protein
MKSHKILLESNRGHKDKLASMGINVLWRKLEGSNSRGTEAGAPAADSEGPHQPGLEQGR